MPRYRVSTKSNLSVSHNGKVYLPGSVLPDDLTEEQVDGLFESAAIEEASEPSAVKTEEKKPEEGEEKKSEEPGTDTSSNPRPEDNKKLAAPAKLPATSKSTTTKPATGEKL